MIKRISHIGIAVKSLNASKDLFTKLLGKEPEHTETVEEQNATISFYPIGDSSLELIESSAVPGQGSSIGKFIERRGEGIHHICLEVENLALEISRLKNLGFQFVDDTPSPGGDGKLVAFIHPKSANGVLVELSETIR
ncbi:MAG TPA: VOC family protein [Bacteroidota bacterium]|nr:VOC family protein [Bacteroidota bacterium]